jgi:hypothetical protein
MVIMVSTLPKYCTTEYPIFPLQVPGLLNLFLLWNEESYTAISMCPILWSLPVGAFAGRDDVLGTKVPSASLRSRRESREARHTVRIRTCPTFCPGDFCASNSWCSEPMSQNRKLAGGHQGAKQRPTEYLMEQRNCAESAFSKTVDDMNGRPDMRKPQSDLAQSPMKTVQPGSVRRMLALLDQKYQQSFVKLPDGTVPKAQRLRRSISVDASRASIETGDMHETLPDGTTVIPCSPRAGTLPRNLSIGSNLGSEPTRTGRFSVLPCYPQSQMLQGQASKTTEDVHKDSTDELYETLMPLSCSVIWCAPTPSQQAHNSDPGGPDVGWPVPQPMKWLSIVRGSSSGSMRRSKDWEAEVLSACTTPFSSQNMLLPIASATTTPRAATTPSILGRVLPTDAAATDVGSHASGNSSSTGPSAFSGSATSESGTSGRQAEIRKLHSSGPAFIKLCSKPDRYQSVYTVEKTNLEIKTDADRHSSMSKQQSAGTSSTPLVPEGNRRVQGHTGINAGNHEKRRNMPTYPVVLKTHGAPHLGGGEGDCNDSKRSGHQQGTDCSVGGLEYDLQPFHITTSPLANQYSLLQSNSSMYDVISGKWTLGTDSGGHPLKERSQGPCWSRPGSVAEDLSSAGNDEHLPVCFVHSIGNNQNAPARGQPLKAERPATPTQQSAPKVHSATRQATPTWQLMPRTHVQRFPPRPASPFQSQPCRSAGPFQSQPVVHIASSLRDNCKEQRHRDRSKNNNQMPPRAPSKSAAPSPPRLMERNQRTSKVSNEGGIDRWAAVAGHSARKEIIQMLPPADNLYMC